MNNKKAKPPLTSKNIEAIYPLSSTQQGMLFHSLYAPKSGVYIGQITLILQGDINFAILQSAWQKLINRHSAFRTSFIWENRATPLQVVWKQVELPWTNLNWSELSSTKQQQQLLELLTIQKEQGFQFNKAPLMGCTLIHLSENTYQFIWHHHHILMDGWCLPIIIKELLKLYEAELHGEACRLPTPVPYRNYITWLNAQDKVAAKEFWNKTLHGFNAPTPLFVERTSSQTQPSEYDSQELELRLDPDQSRKLQLLVQEHHLTLSTLVQAVWGLLLSRYSGESDILFGVTVSGRPASLTGIETMVGLFINTLPLRLQVSPNQTLFSWLEQIQQLTLEMQNYSYTPLVEIQSLSEVSGGTPLFESIVVFENYPVDRSLASETGSLQLSQIESREKTNYPLTIIAVPGDQLSVKINYDPGRFAKDFIEQMLVHLQTIFSAVVENPQQKVGEIPLLSEAERHQLLVEWNDTEQDYPKDKCIHQLFEEQVERTPYAIAVVFEDQELTYRQLNERANQLAHYLQTLGVGPEVLVGICVERSLEMVIGILGILKAGGAYVPLDPGYPQERLSYMLDDAAIGVLLTQERLLSSVPVHSTQVLCLDRDWEAIEQHNSENVHTGVAPDNLVYVIYTSGSTGQPKGVLNTHQGIRNRLLWMQDTYQLTSSDRVLQKTPFVFDVSVWEFFWPLITAARIVVAIPDGHKDSNYLINLIAQKQVTTIHFVPSMLQTFLQDQNLENCSSLRQVFCSGEALSFKLVEQFFENLKCELHNLYGPTEAAIDVTFWQCQSQSNYHSIPIGRPIANTQIYILDSHLQLVPIGVAGELHIGGDGLARGYLNRPELTAEKFIANPFSTDPSARLYKTGDLARYLPDGNIEYLGRIDHQVKIRGFRIELGEVEAVLTQHPQVQQAVVTAPQDAAGNKRLVAYVVSAGEAPSTPQLRDYLQHHLPEYMVPGVFVVLDALPLTPNGKIDRQALPQPDLEDIRTGEYVAPQTWEEELLAQIWSEVLGVSKVGAHDNFFDLGGDSLLSVQVLSKVKNSGLEVSLQQLFNHRTVRELAKVLQQSDSSPSVLTEPFSLINSEERQLLPNGLEDAYPLTKLQMGMLFHSEYTPETALYHDVFSFYLQAPLDIPILHSAIRDIIARHPVLRTSITLSQFSRPLQLVHSQGHIKLTVDDLSSSSFHEQEQIIATWIEQEKKHPFNWEEKTLARFNIHQRGVNTFNFTLSFHHAILDGWSVATLMTELFQHYFFLLDGKRLPLKAVPNFTFRDYVALEQEKLQSQECQQYWHEKLEDFTITKLPRLLKHQRHDSLKQIGQQKVNISPSLSAQLRQLATKVGVPLKSVLLAAHLRVMSVLSNHTDIITGVVTHGRPVVEDSERVLGLFLNTMPLRMQLSGGTWIELVEQTFEQEREILPFQQYPLAQLQQEVGLGQPLFETMFNYVNFHVYQGLVGIGNVEFKGGQSFERNNFSFMAQFFVNPITDEISLSLDFDPSQFICEQMRSISGYYTKVLMAMVNQPNERYEQVCLLSDVEQHQLLVEWNDTEQDYPKDKCIHQLFEEQVERTPDAVAVVFEEQQLTYQQLNERSNQLAHYLQRLGVGPEVLVGIWVERSVEMVVGLLGILKAGGAYVPLDPTYPTERLSFMLTDAGVTVLVTQHHLVSSLPLYETRVVCLDSDWATIEQHRDENLVTNVSAHNLAYVIFTSGSTGQPKGVAIEHHSVVNFLNCMSCSLGLTQEDRFSAVTTLSFDIAALELYLPLIVGAEVIVISRKISIHADRLLSELWTSKTTVIQATPATWQMLLAEGWSSGYPLKVLCGGEALSPQLACQILATGSELWNLYGPTEATIWSTLQQVRVAAVEGQSCPIGRPISNTQVYILDAYLQPVAIGVAGELYIGGDGLARGYLNRSELTAEKFIPHPFSTDPGARLYKSGDLGRYLPDGNIEFLGRLDHQVKIRGYRIELGEIEAVLTQHPQVQQAVVIAAEEESTGIKRLVGYVVSQEEHLSTAQLREYLQQRIPSYMVPAVLVRLDSLPLTPNGKVDRKALPTPDGTIARKQEYVAPRTPSEELMASIFGKVLGVDPVSIYDNFFEVGGHSLLATQLISRLRQSFEVELPLKALFESPTIAQLDQKITQLRMQGKGLSLPPIERTAPEQEDIPLSFAQERLWFLDQLEGASATYNIHAALRLSGELNLNALQQTLEEVVRRHEVLRTSFANVDGTPVQVIHPEVSLDIEQVSLQHLEEGEQQEVLDQQLQQFSLSPFDLETAPLTRTKLWQLSDSEHVFGINMHHIISDFWSMGVLIQEVSVLYQAFCAGKASPLPELEIQYADFALWQRQQLQGEQLQNQLSYWQNQLADAPALLELPTDHLRPAVQSFQGNKQSLILPKSLTKSLKILSQQEGVTLFMTLLAAFKVLLFRYTGKRDIIIGYPSAGRNQYEIEKLIGCFIDVLVLRTDLSGNVSFRELLYRIRKGTLDASTHQINISFEQLVKELQPERKLSHTPIFQVMFNLLSYEEYRIEAPNLEVEAILLPNSKHWSIFDLTLYAIEREKELEFAIVYNTALFEDATIIRMLEHLQNLLVDIIIDVEKDISSLSLLTANEKENLLNQFNDVFEED
ncbi:MAG: non-ribosomal peptide synthetase [Hapalosiphonaceae cyanobacterium JJU2]|nr:MAG: non-ribosomal peptide synthetase [Hapalosiphonaceae cyanobacterium JJU2]